MLARCCPQRKQTLFNIVDFILTETDRRTGVFNLANAFVGIDQSLFQCFGNRIVTAVHQTVGAFDRRLGATYRRQDIGTLTKAGIGNIKIFENLFGIHHLGAAGGKFRFFARNRFQFFQFVHPAAQIVFIGFGLIEVCFKSPTFFNRPTIKKILFADGIFQNAVFAVTVQNVAMRRRIQQTLIIKLSVNFDQMAPEFFQNFDRHRLIVNEYFSFAVAVQGSLNNNFAVQIHIILFGQRIQRML